MSKIEWTEATWNPIVGCSIVSPGCTHCYAMRVAARLEAMQDAAVIAGKDHGPAPHYSGTTKWVNGTPVWTGKLALAPERTLTEPLRRRKPTTYLVNSMGDLFHEDCPDEWISHVFYVMAQATHHTFQILTKRAANMRRLMSDRDFIEDVRATLRIIDAPGQPPWTWPLPNVWLGVSAERQAEADVRIPDLLATPAAVRFVSAEPLLGPIDFERIRCRNKCTPPDYCTRCYPDGGIATGTIDALQTGLDWVIVGGESGPGARPMHPDWARSIRDQCTAAGVPFFFKQWGAFGPGSAPSRAELGHERVVLIDGTACLFVKGRCEDAMRTSLAKWPDRKPTLMTKVGKARAGRLLDGREWNEMPGAGKYDQAPTDPHHGGKVSP